MALITLLVPHSLCRNFRPGDRQHLWRAVHGVRTAPSVYCQPQSQLQVSRISVSVLLSIAPSLPKRYRIVRDSQESYPARVFVPAAGQGRQHRRSEAAHERHHRRREHGQDPGGVHDAVRQHEALLFPADRMVLEAVLQRLMTYTAAAHS